MFTVIFHDEAEKSLRLCLLPFSKMAKAILMKLEANPRQLRRPDTKPLGNGLFEIRTMGADIARGIWVYQSGERIFLLRIFIKNRQKRPGRNRIRHFADWRKCRMKI